LGKSNFRRGNFEFPLGKRTLFSGREIKKGIPGRFSISNEIASF
jgi:hypothetical protein